MVQDSPDSRMVHPAYEGTEEFETDSVLDDYGVGIDTHSRFIQVCVLLNLGGGLKRIEGEFQTDWEDLRRCRNWVLGILQAYTHCEEHDLHYTIESTGVYHLPVVRALGGKPRIINPMLAGATKRKTDVLDARLLSHHDISGLWRDSYVPSDEVQVLRVIEGERVNAQKRKTRCSNRILNVLLRFGHTFGSYSSVGSSFSLSVIEDLCAGRLPDVIGLCPDGLPAGAAQVLTELVGEYHQAAAREKQCSARLEAMASHISFPAGPDGAPMPGGDLLQLLTTVPGVGKGTALRWMAQVCDVRRFASAKACAAYCGLDPSLKVSAGKVTNFTRRGGNELIRGALVTAAGNLINRKAEPFGQWGYRLMKSHAKGGYRKAQGAVARRIAVALYHVQRTATPFSIELYRFHVQPELPDVPLEQMNLGRFENAMRARGLLTSRAVAKAYYTDLAAEKGIGEKCLKAIQSWIAQQPGSALPSSEPSSAGRVRPSAIRLLRKSHTASSQTETSAS